LDDRVGDIKERRERKGIEKIDTETRFIRKITRGKKKTIRKKCEIKV